VRSVGRSPARRQAVEAAEVEDEVERAGQPAEARDIAQAKVNGHAGSARLLARQLDRAPGEVHAGHLPAVLRQGDGVCARPASQVQRPPCRMAVDEGI